MTADSLTVPLAELRRAFELAIAHAEAAVGTQSVTLDQDYFWSIPPEQVYDVYNRPSDLTVGQLSESWQHLSDLLAHEDRALGYHLVWLADVLRAIGQSTP
ncbi:MULTISPECIES: hypothetical protein [unclassified Nocardia]|uniref:hypothetical protein n=1 Tax=unclassified Nocardia TaxID=2637762 RepID=UPI00278BE027|nr:MULTISPECIES: hypothetical protein [unclassified Nocardia]